MALKVWAVGYRHSEDTFYDFEKKEDSYDLEPTCFLPTCELAEQMIEEELTSYQYAPVEITIELVKPNLWSWYRGDFPDWDDFYGDEDDEEYIDE
jgi:hypothetical protein